MKIGDLVKHRSWAKAIEFPPAGIVVEMTEKKVWRTDTKGNAVDWNAVEPELHAVVLFSHNDGTLNIPVVELEVVNESR